MLKESYIAVWSNTPGLKVRVARPSVLAPSAGLLAAYKDGLVSWPEYEAHFRAEILASPKAVRELCRLKKLAETQDVFLMCYEKNPPCHRFILLEMAKEMKEDA